MKIKTALKLFLLSAVIFGLTFFSPITNLSAQTMEEKESFDVIVNANVNIDLYSQLSLSPSTVEVLQPASVNITTINPDGTPRAERSIEIYVQGNSAGVLITQPGVTDAFGETSGDIRSSIPGSYVVCAKDTTEGFDIFIEDCETLYVIPVPAPTMLEEPEYTKGDSNTVMWDMAGVGTYKYYVEVSTDAGFSTVKDNSGWISNLAYEFRDLENGQMYFYRVKARNSYGGESGWSNIVFSVQDATGPEIVLISISDIGDNTNVTWDRNYTINIRYRITDNIDITKKEFWCVGNEDSRYDCLYMAAENGDFWDISIQLKNLEKTSSGNLFEQYKFCVEATDAVNNVSRNCEAKLDVTIETPEEEIPPPVIPRIPLITRIRERLERVFDDTLLRLKEFDMTDLTVTTAVVNLLVGFGLLLTALGYLPHFIIQLILGLLSLLGFRKKGNPTGYVYDSVTKEPINQAIVRVFTEVHELVWTSVTDSNGYFNTTEMKDGEYHIKVTAQGYTFPSKIVFGKTDFPLENVYHGDPFLTREERIPDFSIPMDKEEETTFRRRVAKFFSRTKFLWRVLHVILFVFGLLLSIYAVHITPVWWNYLILGLYVPASVGLWYSFFGKRGKYGVVKDTEKKVVAGAIVGLKEKEFGKLVSKRVTDKSGKYRFLVDKGVYSLSILNSDLKLIEEDKYSELVVEKEGGEVLAPDIKVKRLEDDVKDEDVIEPLEEL
jgi:hypothetical protein